MTELDYARQAKVVEATRPRSGFDQSDGSRNVRRASMVGGYSAVPLRNHGTNARPSPIDLRKNLTSLDARSKAAGWSPTSSRRRTSARSPTPAPRPATALSAAFRRRWISRTLAWVSTRSGGAASSSTRPRLRLNFSVGSRARGRLLGASDGAQLRPPQELAKGRENGLQHSAAERAQAGRRGRLCARVGRRLDVGGRSVRGSASAGLDRRLSGRRDRGNRGRLEGQPVGGLPIWREFDAGHVPGRARGWIDAGPDF